VTIPFAESCGLKGMPSGFVMTIECRKLSGFIPMELEMTFCDMTVEPGFFNERGETEQKKDELTHGGHTP
jgi:hypothetical protein